jgi:hypothetical protein
LRVCVGQACGLTVLAEASAEAPDMVAPVKSEKPSAARVEAITLVIVIFNFPNPI